MCGRGCVFYLLLICVLVCLCIRHLFDLSLTLLLLLQVPHFTNYYALPSSDTYMINIEYSIWPQLKRGWESMKYWAWCEGCKGLVWPFLRSSWPNPLYPFSSSWFPFFLFVSPLSPSYRSCFLSSSVTLLFILLDRNLFLSWISFLVPYSISGIDTGSISAENTSIINLSWNVSHLRCVTLVVRYVFLFIG